jgi:tetratricopeptide (TPR) repeat protein
MLVAASSFLFHFSLFTFTFMKTLLIAAWMLVASAFSAFSVVSVFAQAASQAASQADFNTIFAAKQLLTNATVTGSVGKITESAATFAKLSETVSAPQKPLAHYYAGLANYRLTTLERDETKREQATDEALKHLEQATELDKTFADAFALLSSVYGMKAKGMIGGMKFGPKSASVMETAQKLAPKNPRVLLLAATSLYFKPAMWGGDKKKAVETWQQAASIFDDTKKADTYLPDWGHEETYAWLGQAFASEGNTDAAKASYERALEIRPDYAWVKYVLLPKLAQK